MRGLAQHVVSHAEQLAAIQAAASAATATRFNLFRPPIRFEQSYARFYVAEHSPSGDHIRFPMRGQCGSSHSGGNLLVRESLKLAHDVAILPLKLNGSLDTPHQDILRQQVLKEPCCLAQLIRPPPNPYTTSQNTC